MDIIEATETAKLNAVQYSHPYLVTYSEEGYDVVRGSEYKFNLHGVVERIRYPKKYHYNKEGW